METARQILAKVHDMTEQAKGLLADRNWEEAERVLTEAIGLDERNAFAIDLLAKCYEGAGKTELAEKTHARAKLTREENWKREVEGDIRSHHEMMGKKVQHEIP